MKNSLLKTLNYIVWFFIFISVVILLYSFTQPKMEMELTLFGLLTFGIGFGTNSWLKKKLKEQEED